MAHSSLEELLRDALSTYAGSHVLEYVISLREEALMPRQATREVSLLFADVGRVMPPAGGIDSSKLFEWQEAFLGAISQSILESKGYIDQFVGDAVSCWWERGPGLDDAQRACIAALDMARRIERLNSSAWERGHPKVELKIGIHTGLAAVGPYGSRYRLRFGLSGDSVNFAAHLCRVSGTTYSCRVVISGTTRSRLPASACVSRLDRIQVKGLDVPLELFALDSL